MAALSYEVTYQQKYRIQNKEKVYAIEKASKQKAREKNPLQFLFWAAKTKCKRLGIEFSIVMEDLILPEKCPLLGIPLKINYGIRDYSSPSLDRIDPSKGYTKDNVWVISWRANDLKGNGSLEELTMLVKNLNFKLNGVL